MISTACHSLDPYVAKLSGVFSKTSTVMHRAHGTAGKPVLRNIALCSADHLETGGRSSKVADKVAELDEGGV